jgi:hypothetical protein
MGIIIRNNIVNQKGNPAWYEDTLSNRPTANLQGRMFVDTNNPSTGIYRDTGSSWVAVADPGAGTTGTLQQVTTNGSTTDVGISITTLTPGSVLFSGTGGLISQDNTNLFWDDANNFLGIGPTGGPTALLDIHSATQNVFIQVNATSTNNSQVAFLNGGVGKWRIGNLYNAGANDYIIYDTTNSLSRLTIKNTGQTFIGSTTTSSGSFVVNNATSDNHIVVLGANGPSLRFRNAGTGATLNTGLGISTSANNFIQGSASGDYCIFNSSTTASPILFGIYNSGAAQTQEAARISSSRNFLIGTVIDTGQKLSVNGSVKASNYFLDGMTAGDGALYWNTDRVTLANYNVGGSVLIEVNGGNNILSLGSDYNSRFYGDVSLNGAAGDRTLAIQTNTSGSPILVLSAAGDNGGTLSYIRGSSLIRATMGSVKWELKDGVGFSVTGTASFSSSISIGNSVTASVLNTVTNKVSIIIGGVQYYLLASTSAV